MLDTEEFASRQIHFDIARYGSKAILELQLRTKVLLEKLNIEINGTTRKTVGPQIPPHIRGII